ncbi:MAG: hypothetical protein ACD_3C00083G0006 [uncultured bacterium (gcode 4)]|uniref:ATPase n=1 Tax=uncultured bacterium (gcode 4) TaxID=1234023 RepID=K2G1Y9_9BACT|nr:MAG: hypothetical protein ACD_3C00083G0006 [uncultured bacterium (gcode 4)]
MKFYNREKEIEALKGKISWEYFEFIYLLGKRRVWKTALIEHLNQNILDKDFLYIFVERQDLSVFLQKQESYVFQQTGIKYSFGSIEDFLEYFFLQDAFNLIVFDEFQNFEFMDKSIFSMFQKKIDSMQNNSNKKMIVLWSIQSMMVRIFEDIKEPLYKRSTFSILLREFTLSTQKEILSDLFWDAYSNKSLIDLYSIFWWIPYYFKSIERLNLKNYDFKTILKNLFFDDFALLRNEWKEVLIEEFWQKYKRFFAILEAISIGKNKRNEIMDFVWLGTWEIDVYLKELADIYDIIEVSYPILETKKNISTYYIKDNFLNFWFRYVFANKSKIELWLYDQIVDEISENWWNYLWFKFEKFVKEFLIEKNIRKELDYQFTKIWRWEDRLNNEIDLIFTDERDNITFLEIKLNPDRINQAEKNQLDCNINIFLNKNPLFKDKILQKWFAVYDEKELIKIIYYN